MTNGGVTPQDWNEEIKNIGYRRLFLKEFCNLDKLEAPLCTQFHLRTPRFARGAKRAKN